MCSNLLQFYKFMKICFYIIIIRLLYFMSVLSDATITHDGWWQRALELVVVVARGTGELLLLASMNYFTFKVTNVLVV